MGSTTNDFLWDRGNEIQCIETYLKTPPSRFTPNIHYFCGMSGVGKTRLFEYALNYMKSVLPSQSIESVALYFDYTFPDNRETEENIVRNIYNRLRTYENISFTKYELAHAYLFEITQDPAYRLDSTPNQVSHSVLSALASTGVSACETILLADTIVGQLLSSLGQKLFPLLKDEGKKVQMSLKVKLQEELRSFLNELKFFSKDEIRGNLTRYLIEDINQSMDYLSTLAPDGNYYLVFLLDSFEKRITNPSDWFVAKLLCNLHNVVWIIFGTSSDICDGTSLNVDRHPVGKFSADSLDAHLINSGIHCEEDRKYIIEKSDLLPAAVQILLQIYNGNNHQFDDKSEDSEYVALFDRYFHRHLTSQQKRLFYILSLFDSWSFNTFKGICDAGAIECRQTHHSLFDDITNNTALVEMKSNGSALDTECTYTIIDIARKTLRNKMYATIGVMQDAYNVKFKYESQVVDSMCRSIGKSTLVTEQDFQKLSFHAKNAFTAAIKYYRGEEEFSYISEWCITTEQFMTDKGLFELKSELTNLYLEAEQEKNGFKYDQDNEENKRFRYRMMRDRVWAYRNLGDFTTAFNLAKEYYVQHIITCGAHSPFTPYASYQFGLTFHDIGNYPVARKMYQHSLKLMGQLDEDVVRPFRLPAIVNNVLGCLCMELSEYENAETYFNSALAIGNEKHLNGQPTWYSNLERLYFRWAQDIDRSSPGSEVISKLIQDCKTNGEKARGLWKYPLSVVQRCQKESHEIILDIFSNSCSVSYSSSIDWDSYIIRLTKLIGRLNDFRPKGKSELQMMLGLQNNLAILYALNGQYDLAEKEFASCLSSKLRFFGINIPVDEGELQSQLSSYKPTIRDTIFNQKALKNCLHRTEVRCTRRDFVLQF